MAVAEAAAEAEAAGEAGAAAEAGVVAAAGVEGVGVDVAVTGVGDVDIGAGVAVGLAAVIGAVVSGNLYLNLDIAFPPVCTGGKA